MHSLSPLEIAHESSKRRVVVSLGRTSTRRSAMVSLAARPSEWRDQIQSIINETERNLGGRGIRAAQRQVVSQRPAVSAAGLRLGGGVAGTTYSSLGVATGLAAMPTPPPPPPPQPVMMAAPPAPSAQLAAAMAQSVASAADIPTLSSDASNDRKAAHAALVESVKFELDVRSTLAEKHIQAVRDEVFSNASATEKKWVDIAKQVETNVEGRIEAESQLRSIAEEKLEKLRVASATAHQDTVKMVGDMQQTAIDHSEVLRRLDADLTAFRSSAETKLAEEAQRITKALEAQRELADQIRSGVTPPPAAAASAAAPDDPAAAYLGEVTEARLAEVEQALLAERQFRRQMEDKILEVREGSPHLLETIDTAVATAVERSGSAAAIGALDEKVKECGRLIVRMGTELMEETKRRQALEAETQELRMRLSGVEAVTRSPSAVYAAAGADLATFNPYAPAAGAPGLDASMYGMGAAMCGPDYGDGSGMPSAGGAVDSGCGAAPFMSREVMSATAPASIPHPLGMDPVTVAAASAAAASAAAAGAADGLGAEGALGRAVDARLRDLVPAIHSATASAPSATPAAGAPGRKSGAAALRISRQELDARVQQILGRHGHSLG